MTTSPSKPTPWRSVLPVHPAAEWFPPMPADEQKALGADIRTNGQRVAIAVWKAQRHSQPVLLDGRNRLDAMELVGMEIRVDQVGTDLNPSVKLFKRMPDGPWWPIEVTELSGGDPVAYVFSTNLQRRHLSAKDKRKVIAEVLRAMPEKSDRQIAEMFKVDHKTVASVRAEQEACGEIPRVEARTDSKGRRQPARKPPPEPTEERIHLDTSRR
jgi:hypothetical protein